jgi:hypothetical protein
MTFAATASAISGSSRSYPLTATATTPATTPTELVLVAVPRHDIEGPVVLAQRREHSAVGPHPVHELADHRRPDTTSMATRGFLGTTKRCSLVARKDARRVVTVATKVRLSHGVELRLALQLEDAIRAFQDALRNNELLEIRDGDRVVAVNPQQVVYFEADSGTDTSERPASDSATEVGPAGPQ